MSKATLMDLAAKPVDVALTHPVTGEDLGVTVKMVGKNSRRFKDKFYEAIAEASSDAENAKSSAERMKAAEARGATLIAHCIIGWSDDEFFGGMYSAERALEIVSNPETAWVREQLDAAIVDEKRFFVM